MAYSVERIDRGEKSDKIKEYEKENPGIQCYFSKRT